MAPYIPLIVSCCRQSRAPAPILSVARPSLGDSPARFSSGPLGQIPIHEDYQRIFLVRAGTCVSLTRDGSPRGSLGRARRRFFRRRLVLRVLRRSSLPSFLHTVFFFSRLLLRPTSPLRRLQELLVDDHGTARSSSSSSSNTRGTRTLARRLLSRRVSPHTPLYTHGRACFLTPLTRLSRFTTRASFAPSSLRALTSRFSHSSIPEETCGRNVQDELLPTANMSSARLPAARRRPIAPRTYQTRTRRFECHSPSSVFQFASS